jgi:hypothetical protein
VGLLLRCREDPCLQGRCKTLFKPTLTSTQTSCVSSSTGWSSPSKGGTTLIISSSYCWKNSRQPSYKWAPQQCLIHLSCSNHLPTHQVGMLRTRDRSPLTSPAMIGYSDWPNGSNIWTESRWPATPMGTPHQTSPLLLTFMPPWTPGERTMHLKDSQGGSSLPLPEVPPPLPCSDKGSRPCPKTIGNMWWRLTTTGPLMSIVKTFLPKWSYSFKNWIPFR